jgi:Sodium/hydrogen exchanger family
VFGLTAARRTPFAETPRVRIVSFATWETVTFVLNVLAFTLIGLELRAILDVPTATQRGEWLVAAGAILLVVILVRLSWVFLHSLAAQIAAMMRRTPGDPGASKPSLQTGLVVGWSGMRGIVTIAAALALPEGFPDRDFILVTAFTVVLSTLLMQGLTLRPLLLWLRLPQDGQIEAELALARSSALQAAMSALDHSNDRAAERLKLEYGAKLAFASIGTTRTIRPAAGCVDRWCPTHGVRSPPFAAVGGSATRPIARSSKSSTGSSSRPKPDSHGTAVHPQRGRALARGRTGEAPGTPRGPNGRRIVTALTGH